MRRVCITGLSASAAGAHGLRALVDLLSEGGVPTPTPGHEGMPLCAFDPPGDPSQLALEVCREALSQGPPPGDLVLVGASSVGHLGRVEDVLEAACRGEPGAAEALHVLWSHLVHEPTAAVARALGCQGLRLTLSTACTSGATALAVGGDLVRSGRAQAALVFGVDVPCKLTQLGFAGMGVVTSSRCRPFSEHRDGMWLGEGAAAVLLESEAHAGARGAEVLAVLAGWGLRNDAHSMSAPHPEGRGAVQAIRASLGDTPPEAVDLVCAHGTGTVRNDAMEALVLSRELPGVPISAFKGTTGHTLGAAGVLEAVLTVEAMASGRVLPSQAGPAPGLDLVRETRPLKVSQALSVNFAFGGHSTSLHLVSPRTRPQQTAPTFCSAGIGAWQVHTPLGDQLGERLRHRTPCEPGVVMRCASLPRPPELARGTWRRASRLTRMVLATAMPLLRGRSDLEDLGLVLGSALGEVGSAITLMQRWVDEGTASPLAFQSSVHSAPAAHLSIALGLRDHTEALAAGGATSLVALSRGLQLVEEGRVPAALVLVADLVPAFLEAALASLDLPVPVSEVVVAALIEPGGRRVCLGPRPTGEVLARVHALPRETDHRPPSGVTAVDPITGLIPSPGLALLLESELGVVESSGGWELGACWE